MLLLSCSFFKFGIYLLKKHPTKAICPILLEDYRKIMVDRKGETNFFTSQMIKNCMRKVKVVNLHQVQSLLLNNKIIYILILNSIIITI